MDCNATTTLTRVQFDIVEDPLKCPLDLGHLHTDVFQGDIGLKVLLDDHDIRTKLLSVQFKPVPGIDLFEVKPDFSSQIKLKTFLTPFQRFQVRHQTSIWSRPDSLSQISSMVHVPKKLFRYFWEKISVCSLNDVHFANSLSGYYDLLTKPTLSIRDNEMV